MDDIEIAEGGRSTQRSDDLKQKLIVRLNRIEGQVRGVRRMLENDAYCADILVQSAAINAALGAFNRELLRAHVSHCVVRDIRAGDDKTVEELIKTLEILMR